jgi:hypothetical protein
MEVPAESFTLTDAPPGAATWGVPEPGPPVALRRAERGVVVKSMLRGLRKV